MIHSVVQITVKGPVGAGKTAEMDAVRRTLEQLGYTVTAHMYYGGDEIECTTMAYQGKAPRQPQPTIPEEFARLRAQIEAQGNALGRRISALPR